MNNSGAMRGRSAQLTQLPQHPLELHSVVRISSKPFCDLEFGTLRMSTACSATSMFGAAAQISHAPMQLQ
jgi:hypothetical protein